MAELTTQTTVPASAATTMKSVKYAGQVLIGTIWVVVRTFDSCEQAEEHLLRRAVRRYRHKDPKEKYRIIEQVTCTTERIVKTDLVLDVSKIEAHEKGVDECGGS